MEEKITMTDIEKALRQDDKKLSMEKIGFKLITIDKEVNKTHYFHSQDGNIIVVYDYILNIFWTFSKANSRGLNTPY